MTIRKVSNGKFVVTSKSGKVLSKPTTRAKAVRQLRAIEASKAERKK